MPEQVKPNPDAQEKDTKAAPKPIKDAAAAEEFTNKLLGIEPEKKVEPPPAPPPEKPKKKSKPAEKPEPPQQPDYESLVKAAAEGAARAIKPEEKKPEPPPEDDLPAEEKRKLAVLSQMEKNWPDKYKGLEQRYRGSLDKLLAYAERWEKEHPGKEFDEAEKDEEGNEIHKEFLDKNDVDWEDDDYIDALTDIKNRLRPSSAQKCRRRSSSGNRWARTPQTLSPRAAQ
jgi:hypothetical protein